jgi:hypothetical protein
MFRRLRDVISARLMFDLYCAGVLADPVVLALWACVMYRVCCCVGPVSLVAEC